MQAIKYPRTPHLPFSPGGTSDDRRLTSVASFIGKPIVITEKLDGGCTLLHDGVCYARSVSEPTNHPSFDFIKNVHAPKTLGTPGTFFYGENMYGIHSIEYDWLQDYFYLFAVKDNLTHKWVSWDRLEAIEFVYDFKLVPLVFKGVMETPGELEQFIQDSMTPAKEGFVVRTQEAFFDHTIFSNVAKYVRAGHVQTDEHWTRNWQKASLSKEV
jgi:RNA ligase